MRKFRAPSPYLIALAGIAGAGVTAGAKYFIQSRSRRAHRSAISLPPGIAENIRPWVVFNPSKHDDPQEFRNSLTMDARALGVRDIHFIETSIADPGVSQARKAVRAGATHVIAAGGDGTVRAVAAGLGSEDPSSARKETAAQRLAHNTIRRQTGWNCQAPLSEQRCITREALNAIMPFANGYGLELDMKVRLLALGMTAIELPCAFEHTGEDHSLVALNRSASLADVAWTSTMLALRKVRLRRRYRTPVSLQRLGAPYPDPEHTPVSQSPAGETS